MKTIYAIIIALALVTCGNEEPKLELKPVATSDHQKNEAEEAANTGCYPICTTDGLTCVEFCPSTCVKPTNPNEKTYCKRDE